MGKGSRQKGSGFERDVARQIIATFADLGIDKQDCYRTPLSGGHRFAKHTDPGDLMISAKLRPYWPFAVECKFYKSIEIKLLLQRDIREGHFAIWWDQTLAAAKLGKGWVPLLVFRANLWRDTYAILPDAKILTNAMTFGTFRPVIKTRVNGMPVQVVRFSALLKRARKYVQRKT